MMPAVLGSFDFAGASLRETPAALRMTILIRTQGLDWLRLVSPADRMQGYFANFFKSHSLVEADSALVFAAYVQP